MTEQILRQQLGPVYKRLYRFLGQDQPPKRRTPRPLTYCLCGSTSHAAQAVQAESLPIRIYLQPTFPLHAQIAFTYSGVHA